VLYRETHKLLEELAEATLDGTRKQQMDLFSSVPLQTLRSLFSMPHAREPGTGSGGRLAP